MVDGIGPSLGGIVLCGGESTRMGRSKAWLPIGEEFLLQRVVRVVGEAVGPVVVVAAEGQEVPPLPATVELVRDRIAGKGPLAGFLAGLEAFADRVDAVYLSAGDMPFLRPGFVRRVVESLAEFDIAVPRVDGRRHPLAGVYRTSVRAAAEGLLATRRAGPVHLFDVVPTRYLGPEAFADVDPGCVSLRNVNTPEEYAAALEELWVIRR